MAADVVGRLAPFIAAMEPDASEISISDVERSGIGYSRENWTFDAQWRRGDSIEEHRLIMRRDPTGSVLRTDRQTEYSLLKVLEATTIPSPRALWLDAEGKWFDRPSLVMDRIDGECQMFVIEGPDPVSQRLRLAHDCLMLLTSVHGLDWPALGLGPILGFNGNGGATVEVDKWTAEMRDQQMEEDDRLDRLAAWLHDAAPQPQIQVLVHGDFKPGNMLLRDGKIVGLLDWETAHIGDPIEDLGWITNPLRRREHQIQGVWEATQIADRYQEITGLNVDPDELRYWNVFANFKLAVIVLTGMRSYAEGRSDVPYDFPVQLLDLAFQLIEGGHRR